MTTGPIGMIYGHFITLAHFVLLIRIWPFGESFGLMQSPHQNSPQNQLYWGPSCGTIVWLAYVVLCCVPAISLGNCL